jgi:hypothetical protein
MWPEEAITIATCVMGFPVLDCLNIGLASSNGHVLSFLRIVFLFVGEYVVMDRYSVQIFLSCAMGALFKN